MRNTVYAIGENITSHLAGSERAIDEGIIAQAQLIGEVIKARLKLNFAAHAHRDLIRDTGAAFAEQLAVRERFLDLHDRFQAVATRMGYDPDERFGGSGDKDGNGIQTAGSLALVPSQALAA